MSILTNQKEYQEALAAARKAHPLKASYLVDKDDCVHDFSEVIYTGIDGVDIVRCPRCGEESVVRHENFAPVVEQSGAAMELYGEEDG